MRKGNLNKIIVFFLTAFVFSLPVLGSGADSREPMALSSIIDGLGELAETVKGFDEATFREKEAALEKSEQVKGVYMTSFTASSPGSVAEMLRERISKLLRETELNGVVIDVKETSGPSFSETLKDLVIRLHREEVWTIARVAALRDYSQTNKHPEWYLRKEDGSLWRDESGFFWLDPACKEVQDYILGISKMAIDFGFDEIQFDYLRFPDRGDLKNIVYPCFEGGKKSETINDFYLKLCQGLRAYKKDLILSIDLFGQVAQYFEISKTGQRLEDAVGKFDYISFMLYPSHYFNGFIAPADSFRDLPYLYFPYDDQELKEVASNHPYEVVFRSILQASDYISSISTSGSQMLSLSPDFSFLEFLDYFCSQYVSFLKSSSRVVSRIRPWLQDFDLKIDKDRGIYYDAEKVRAQIEAAEDADSFGWLLWSPINVYASEALKK